MIELQMSTSEGQLMLSSLMEKRLRGKTEMAWTCAEEGWIY